MTTGGSKVFVDTNVLVYARSALSPFHTAAVSKLHGLTTAGSELWVSRQILREYLATTTRPGTIVPPLPVVDLIADVAGFLARFHIAEDSPAVFAPFLSLLAAVPCGGRQVHDANIVATMLAHGVPSLLTHNTADFGRFGGYIAVVPLVP